MPLTDKGRKIMKAMKEKYGKKKGESIFYASKNKGKIKGVEKLRYGGDTMGGKNDRSRGDLTGPRELGMTTRGPKSPTGNVGGRKTKTITPKTPPTQINTTPLGIFTPPSVRIGLAAYNKISKGLYDSKNLKEQKEIDVLGGEMLTTGPKGPPNTDRAGKDIKPTQPIQSIEATKPVDQNLVSPRDNFFNFVAYKVGGLSGGVSYGPPPKKGPNSQVPPVKMKRGGYKK